MEVVRDRADNCIIVCSIENVDPMGIHTGDSITVAPALTLTDKEYQRMRNASIAVLREIGVDTGGSNVQFAINPDDGRMVIIEMNPRVSRSSALASKATGFPIAKIAARLAVGYTLDEVVNDITGCTPASFEPTIDYVVTKIPRFTFEKFPETDPTLTTSMKSVGEVMAIGRDVRGIAAKGAARAGDRPRGPRRDRDRGAGGSGAAARCGAGGAGAPHPRPAAGDRPGLPARLQRPGGPPRLPVRSLVPRADPQPGRHRGAGPPGRRARRARRAARAEGAGLLRCPPGAADRPERGRGPVASLCARRPRRVQADRHLRGRVRSAHAVSLQLLRAGARRAGIGMRGHAQRPAQGDDPGRRSEPDRPGHRVRLLLLPRGVRARRGRDRDHHGQLQSRDGVDRLRHLRPAVFRAADRRGRARDHAGRGERRRAVRRDRPARRPDPAQARRAAERSRGPDPRHVARFDRPGGGPRALSEASGTAAAAPAGQRHLLPPRGGAGQGPARRLPGGDPAVLRARRPRHADRARAERARRSSLARRRACPSSARS